MSDKRAEILAWLDEQAKASEHHEFICAGLPECCGVGDGLPQAVAALRGEVEAIRHREIDDCWYSCPKALDADGNSACCDERQTECNCGADQRIDRIHAATVGAK